MFKVGDVVGIKSGGPVMTVTEVNTRNGVPTVWCVWFANGQEQTGAYPVDALKHIELDG